MSQKTLRILLVALLFSFQAFSAEHVKNVILMIGDGMGLAQISLAHYVKGQKLNMESVSDTGLATNYCLDSFVTDSAAAGTALATGEKTNSGMISTRPDRTRITTILERFMEKGAKTGLVTTTNITDATPASFASHVPNRSSEEAIALQLVNSGVDVLMGGGSDFFLPVSKKGRRKDGLELFQLAAQKGYSVVRTPAEMNIASGRMLGIFGSSQLDFELNRQDQPNLAAMTGKALNLLSGSDKGFFLMVEGGRIDHAAHDNDPVGAVSELLMFDRAVGIALDFARINGDTLVLITADHETGGLVLSNGDYKIVPEVLKKPIRTAEFLENALAPDCRNAGKVFRTYAGIDLTGAEIALLKNCSQKKNDPSLLKKKGDPGRIAFVTKILNERAKLGWVTYSHSACMVAVMADGPCSEMFTGYMDNTDIPKRIAKAAALK
ncbi:MAG: alkaline phosphatase [Candidatus Wallbacteria bacterium]|nr:alkaline phosphatase [Candidatus Wallbacteria bacterium]